MRALVLFLTVLVSCHEPNFEPPVGNAESVGYAKLSWAGIRVQDLPAAIAFYRDVLGLPLTQAFSKAAYFTLPDGNIVELQSGGVASSSVKEDGQQSTIIGLHVENLEHAMAVLSSRGVTFLGSIDGDATERWVYFSDNEGNRLEIKETVGQGN